MRYYLFNAKMKNFERYREKNGQRKKENRGV